jgi:hypothetical protein
VNAAGEIPELIASLFDFHALDEACANGVGVVDDGVEQ